jgi:hypothetical protein
MTPTGRGEQLHGAVLHAHGHQPAWVVVGGEEMVANKSALLWHRRSDAQNLSSLNMPARVARMRKCSSV